MIVRSVGLLHALLGSTGTLLIARTLAYGANFLTPVLLARHLPEAAFGAYRDVLLLGFTCIQVLNLGLPHSLFYLLPSNNPVRGRAVTQALSVLIGVGALLFVATALMGDRIADFFRVPELETVAPLVGLYIAGMLIASMLDSLLLAEGRVTTSAMVTFSLEAIRSILLLSVALIWPSLEVLLVALAVTAGLRFLTLLAVVRPYITRSGWWDPALARSQLAFCAPYALSLLLSTFGSNVDKYFVSWSFGPAIFAGYSLGMTAIPLVDLYFDSQSDVLLPKMQRSREDGDVQAILGLWHTAVVNLSSFLLPLFGILLVSSGDVILTLYTDKYAESITIFTIFLFQLPRLMTPFGAIVRVYGETGFIMKLNFLVLLVSVPLMVVGAYFFQLEGVALAHVISLHLLTFPQIVKGARLLGVGLREMLPWSSLGRLALAVTCAGLAGEATRMSLGLSGPAAVVSVALVYGPLYVVVGTALGVISWDALLGRVRLILSPGGLQSLAARRS